MPPTLQISNKLMVTPLIDIQSADFTRQYELGVRWSMYGDEQGQGPVPASYLVTNLQCYTEADYFSTNDPYHLSHLGFFFGMYHGGILSPHTGQRRPQVTALAHLDHRDAKRGYRAGRAFYFVDAEQHEQRYTECRLIERLRESVTEMAAWHDGESTWFFSVGCVLGELSGQCFPMTPAEQRVYFPQRQRLEQARQRYKAARRSAVTQEVQMMRESETVAPMTARGSSVTVLHEIDLGAHHLFTMSDQSIDLLADEEQASYMADNVISLDADETYRLLISLQEVFKQKTV